MKKYIIRFTVNLSLCLLLLATMIVPANASHSSGYLSPEFLYYIEGTGAYFLPDPDVDIFFSLGNWYRRSDSSWSASVALSGPWGAISVSSVPSVLVGLPHEFRATHHLGRVPYRYIMDSARGHEDYGSRHYRGDYYNDHDRKGYQRHRHSSGSFWVFIAPDLDHHDRDDGHRRRRGRGGKGRDRD